MRKITVKIEKIISNSCGLARHEGRALFIPDTIPGETVTAEIPDVAGGSSYLYGKLKDIITPSPFRVDPVCPLFGICGGCTMQHIDYGLQLEIRKNLVEESLRRNGKIDYKADAALSGKPYGYRSRAQLHPAPGGLPGFQKRGSNETVLVRYCPVCCAGINAFISGMPYLNGNRITVFAPGDECYSGEPCGDFFDESYARPYTGKKTARQEEPLFPVIKVPLKDRIIETDISCFFQSNIPMLEKAVDMIISRAEGKSFYDLYCGVGVFGSFLADFAERIVSVESSLGAVKHARKNIASGPAGASARDFYSIPVERFVKQSENQSVPDCAVIDPPRTGIADSVKKFIAKKKIRKLLYLSCDYATLGRDLGFLVKNGYRLNEISVLDFYPQTAHAESLAVLEYMG